MASSQLLHFPVSQPLQMLDFSSLSYLSHRIVFRTKLDNMKMLFSFWIINLFFLFIFRQIHIQNENQTAKPYKQHTLWFWIQKTWTLKLWIRVLQKFIIALNLNILFSQFRGDLIFFCENILSLVICGVGIELCFSLLNV